MPILGVRGANPIWVLVNLTGKLFDDTYWMWVLSNQIPYIPANVFHDPDLSQVWTNPIQFLANGTLPNDIYFEANQVYRLEFRQNNGLAPPSQSDPLIYLVENYVPGEGGSTPVDTVATLSTNQITNPQFALTNFTSPYTYNGDASSLPNPGQIDVAPGWVLNLAGTGTLTLTLVPLNNSNTNPTNAPYALEITASGWTSGSLILSQRFEQNGMLWANQYVASSITASLGADQLPQNISAQLVDSNGTFLGTILPAQAVDSSFNEFTGVTPVPLPGSTNPDTPPAAYIDYQLLLPSSIDIFVTSIQVTVEDVPVEPSFIQDSINRQIDQTFNYYKNPLSYKPIPSFLIGWDFPLNPAQFGDSVSLGSIGANKSYYLWDQTIGFQTTNNSIAASRSSANNLVLTASGSTQCAIIQYLGPREARKILLNNLSVNAVLASASACNVTISLWWTTNSTLPVLTTGTNNSLVTGLDSKGFPTVVSGWTELTRSNLQHATFTAPTTLDAAESAMNGFSGWEALANSDASTATFFAIVVGTGALTNTQSIEIASISLVPGTIPTIPAPQTIDEVLRECEHYYEKSSNGNILPGNNGNWLGVKTVTLPSADGSQNYYSFPFEIQFSTEKRATPLYNVWNPQGGTIGNVEVSARDASGTPHSADITFATFWTTVDPIIGSASTIGLKGISFTRNSNTEILVPGVAGTTGALFFHYYADARYGLV